jgi:hypothetical protein
MNGNIPLDDNTSFNPRTGEFASRGNNSGNRTTPPRRTTPERNPPQSNFNGWWIAGALIVLFLGYELFSYWNSNEPPSPRIVNLTPTPPPTTPTPSSTPNIYGTGNGQLTVYKVCENCPDLSVSIDGSYVGTLTQTLDSSRTPNCADNGTVSKVLSSGSHTLTGTDSYGNNWNLQVYVTEGQCSTEKLFRTDDTKPNPYGVGYGKVTIYKTCNSCKDLQVSIDGEYIGTLTESFNPSQDVACDAYGTLSKVLPVGYHQYSGKDSYGDTWFSQINVVEGQCTNGWFKKDPDVEPNPYGDGNGQVTIYHNCSTCTNVQVSVDGYNVGDLNAYFNSNQIPTCGAATSGSIIKNLSKGNHLITAKDDNGDSWQGYVMVQESACQDYALENFRQTETQVNYQNNTNTDNTYYTNGNNNGQSNSNVTQTNTPSQYYYSSPPPSDPPVRNNRQPVNRQPVINRQPVRQNNYRRH